MSVGLGARRPDFAAPLFPRFERSFAWARDWRSGLDETHLARQPGGRDIGWFVGKLEMGQDFSDHGSFQDRSDGFEVFTATIRTVFHVNLEDAGQEFCPAHAAGFLAGVLSLGLRFDGGQSFGNHLFLGHDSRADLGVRSQLFFRDFLVKDVLFTDGWKSIRV